MQFIPLLPPTLSLVDLNERFDRVVSIGMIEHVGVKNYRRYMMIVARCLDPEGLFLLHTIGANVSRTVGDPWVDKYIFPDGIVPSLRQLSGASEGLFRIEDVHNFGHYYDTTLLAWNRNFTQGWDRIKERYGERFFRMWRFYLLSPEGIEPSSPAKEAGLRPLNYGGKFFRLRNGASGENRTHIPALKGRSSSR
jgi:cyclopropane fatty-acyl-phospholipid synthase-like methyltransferase